MSLPNKTLSRDAKKVLEILRQVGSRGILAADLRKMQYGKEQTFIARLEDLKNKYHYDIRAKREALGSSWSTRYTLYEGQQARPQYILIDELTKKRYTQDFVEIKEPEYIPRQEAML